MVKRKGKTFLAVLFAVFFVLFAVSAGMIGWNLYQSKQEADAFAALRAQQEAERAAAQAAADAQAALEAGYDSLHAQNADYAGWLTVGGTHIDYPVMWTPSDPNYYLRRAFDRSASASGTPFIAEGADIDSTCLLIYGHEMHNGTMFGDLDLFADPAYLNSTGSVCVSFTTRTEMRHYEVFAAVRTQLLAQGTPGFRYYNAAGPLDQAGFDELVGWLKTNALYDTGITPHYGEQILLLSTCSEHTQDGRFLLAARRVD